MKIFPVASSPSPGRRPVARGAARARATPRMRFNEKPYSVARTRGWRRLRAPRRRRPRTRARDGVGAFGDVGTTRRCHARVVVHARASGAMERALDARTHDGEDDGTTTRRPTTIVRRAEIADGRADARGVRTFELGEVRERGRTALEEKEEAYRLARERIFGAEEDADEAEAEWRGASVDERGGTNAGVDDVGVNGGKMRGGDEEASASGRSLSAAPFVPRSGKAVKKDRRADLQDDDFWRGGVRASRDGAGVFVPPQTYPGVPIGPPGWVHPIQPRYAAGYPGPPLQFAPMPPYGMPPPHFSAQAPPPLPRGPPPPNAQFRPPSR